MVPKVTAAGLPRYVSSYDFNESWFSGSLKLSQDQGC